MFRKTRSQPCFCHSGKALALGSVLLSLLSSPAYAADWTGAVDNDWFNAGNWSGGVPTTGMTGYIDTTVNAPEITSAGAVSRYTYVGNTATGALTVSEGGTLTASGSINIGQNLGSEGMVVVTGAGSSLAANGPSLSVGYSGAGTLTVSDGGRVTSTSSSVIGFVTSGIGTALVTGAGSLWESQNYFFVGHNGTGTLTISSGGQVTSAELTALGYFATGVGTATVTGAGSSWESGNYYFIGNYGTGTLTVSGGGRVTSTAASYLGYRAGSEGTAFVTGVGSSWETSTDFNVGSSGTGFLTVSDGGRVTSTTYSAIGAVAGSEGAAIVTGVGSIFESRGQLRVGASGTGTLTVSDGGLVSSTGTMFIALNAGSTGTLNIGAASGDAAAAAGQVTAPTIRFGGGTGTLVLNHTDGCGADGMGCSSLVGGVETAGAAGSDTGLTISSALTGTGSILAQSGVTSFTGNMSAFTGSTTVSDTARLFLDNAYGGNMTVADGGILSANNTVAGNVTINNDGLLKGNGTIGGDASINAGGRVAPGNSIGTINVGGDVNFAAGSVYDVEVNAAGQSDRIIATGDTNIAGGTINILPEAGGTYAVGTTYTFLTAATINGAFDAVTLNTSSMFLDAALSYDANNAYATLTRNSTSFASLAGTPNEVRTAEALDTMTGSNAVYNTIAGLSTAAEAEGASRALADELHAGIRGSLAAESHRMGNLVGQRVAFSSPQMYVPRQEVKAAPQGAAPATADSSPYERSLRPLSDIARQSETTMWAEVTGGKTEREGDNYNTQAFIHDTEGVVFGIERRRTGEKGWLAGLAFGYEQSDYEVKSRPASGDGKHYRAMAYGTGEAGVLSLRAGAGYGYHTLDTRRHVVFSGYDSVQKAEYDAQTVGGFGEVAAIFSPFGKMYVEPFARASYGAVYLSDIEESGGDGALNAQSDAFAEGSSLIGLRGSQALSFHGAQKACHPAGLLNPCGLLKAEAGWRHLIGQDSPKGTYSFRGSESFVAQGADAPRDALEVKVGLDVALTGQAKFGVSYDGSFAPEASSNAIRAGLIWRW